MHPEPNTKVGASGRVFLLLLVVAVMTAAAGADSRRDVLFIIWPSV